MRLLLVLLGCGMLAACSNGGGGTSAGGIGLFGPKHPYGKPVPGKKGLVYSPASDSGVHIDVRGFPRGTEVNDPWTGMIFLVP